MKIDLDHLIKLAADSKNECMVRWPPPMSARSVQRAMSPERSALIDALSEDVITELCTRLKDAEEVIKFFENFCVMYEEEIGYKEKCARTYLAKWEVAP